jgi:hypothetical protein
MAATPSASETPTLEAWPRSGARYRNPLTSQLAASPALASEPRTPAGNWSRSSGDCANVSALQPPTACVGCWNQAVRRCSKLSSRPRPVCECRMSRSPLSSWIGAPVPTPVPPRVPMPQKSEIRIGLLWHAFGRPNLGVDALSRSNVALLRAACLRGRPDAAVRAAGQARDRPAHGRRHRAGSLSAHSPTTNRQRRRLFRRSASL